MGFSAIDGLVMATRCGSLDPGVVLHLLQAHGLDAEAVQDLLYRHSGLLGVSGISGDMRVLLASSEPSSREAVELFAFRAAREASALACTLEGFDGLVFTGGVGEHAAPVRAMICERLAWLGVRLDPEANQAASGACLVSRGDSRVRVWVIPADEERIIAREALSVVRPAPPGAG
jgi:acetate kinase